MTRPPYAYLSAGKRAGLTMLWNKHLNIARVERASGVPAAIIDAYLKTRDGYPAAITGSRPPMPRRLKATLRGKAHHLVREHAPPITLPRVSCLERD